MIENSQRSTWYAEAFKSKPVQYLLIGLVFIGFVYYFGRKSAIQAVKLDQVDLPSDKDKVNTITREQLEAIISDCKKYFDDLSLVPGSTYFKVKLIQRMLTLTNYELGLVNNQYNNRWVNSDSSSWGITGDNLYTEIENDWWGTEGTWRDKILARLRAIGAGKKSN